MAHPQTVNNIILTEGVRRSSLCGALAARMLSASYRDNTFEHEGFEIFDQDFENYFKVTFLSYP